MFFFRHLRHISCLYTLWIFVLNSPSSRSFSLALWLPWSPAAFSQGSWKLHAFNVFMFFCLFFFCSLSPPTHHPQLLLTSPLHGCDCCLGNPWLLRQPHQACVPSVLIGPTRWTAARSRGTAWWSRRSWHPTRRWYVQWPDLKLFRVARAPSLSVFSVSIFPSESVICGSLTPREAQLCLRMCQAAVPKAGADHQSS